MKIPEHIAALRAEKTKAEEASRAAVAARFALRRRASQLTVQRVSQAWVDASMTLTSVSKRLVEAEVEAGLVDPATLITAEDLAGGGISGDKLAR